jgi:predicted nucleic acid-binding protein
MKPRIYLETSVISYLMARPSRDLVTAANQQITREWWEDRRREFELYISQPVIQESSAGDPEAAKRRLNVLEDYSQLDVTEEAMTLAQELIKQVPLPEKAELDALHIAIATVHGMDYLLTWNCTHIANAALRHHIETICYMMGYEPPIICTPQELMEV